MATAPVKSPLHNFPLTFLRWGNNARCRRPISSSSAAAEGATDSSEPEPAASRRSRAARNRLASCSSSGKEGGGVVGGGDGEVEEAAEQKPWNLRPRKALFSKAKSNGNGGGESREVEGGGSAAAGEGRSVRLRGFTAEQPPPPSSSSSQFQQNVQQQQLQHQSLCFEKNVAMAAVVAEKKRKFWIALSREEIEEDVFVMTGSRPARRPKQRPKNVQKQLDAVFPGLWLVGFTADAYRVAETQAKR